jgi:hypothetical protein
MYVDMYCGTGRDFSFPPRPTKSRSFASLRMTNPIRVLRKA